MKAFTFFAAALLATLLTLSTTSTSEVCNNYVDEVLNDLKEDKEYFQDPYEIEEKTIGVHKKLVFINYTGEASIYDGHIFGLSSLHRDGDVVVDKNKKKTHLKIWLGAGEINMQCSGKVKLMGHGPQVTIEAKIIYINMKMDVVPTQKGSNPKIDNFSIEDVKGMEVKVSGMGPLNFFMNNYIKVVGKIFQRLIRTGVEARLKSFLDKKLKKYEIPEDCLNDKFLRSLRVM